MKAIETLELILLIFIVVITFIINSTVGSVVLLTMVAINIVLSAMGANLMNLWPSVPKRNPDGSSTISLRDAVKSGVFVPTGESTKLYSQQVLDHEKERMARWGFVGGVVITAAVIGVGYGTYKYTRRNKNGK